MIGAVRIPSPVVELDYTNSLFHQFSGQKAVVGKGFLSRLGAVELVDMRRFIVDVHHLRHLDLHAVSHLVLIDPCQDFGVPEVLKIFLVGLIDGRHDMFLEFTGHPMRILKVKHRVAFGSALHPLVDGREKSRTPNALACIGSFSSRSQDHKAG